jgi:cytochrome c551/c552
MLRSIAELVAYGTFAALLTAASLDPQTGNPASSAATSERTAEQHAPSVTSQRGALLFATKGCIGCHIHVAFPNSRMRVGPDLSTLTQRAGTRVEGLDARAYVRQSLRDPQAFTVSGYDVRMMDLRLTDEEIDSLTAFLLSAAR